MQFQKIDGLIAAPYTPMDSKGELNTTIITDYADKLKADGVKGVFVNGTTGEGMLLSLLERKQVLEAWVNEQSDDFKVIAHVGTTSAKQSIELATHATAVEVYALGCMAPMFLKPGNLTDLTGFCAQVAAAAPNLPFYYYHMPSVSGVDLSPSGFIQLASKTIPNSTGIKFTDNNLLEMQKCLNRDGGKWDILHGYDEILLAGLVFGARGAVGSTYNYMAKLYDSIINDFNIGDIDSARLKQAKSVEIIEILIKYGGAIVAGKSIMKLAGINCGPCRLPQSPLTETEVSNMNKELISKGFYEL